MQVIGLLIIIFAALLHCLSAATMCRWRNFNQQIHASSLGETIAPLITLLGIGMLSANYITGLKLVLLAALLLLTSPIATHNLANLDGALKPHDNEGK